jgi:histidinol dehydrogenase
MIQTVNRYAFEDAFKSYDRDTNFSYEGKKALFDYLEELEESTGEQIELDVIALCCEYTEYENLEELKKNYNNIETMEELENNTTVIKIEGTDRFIIQQY